MANQTAVASQLSVRGLHKDQFTYTKCYCEENVYMAIKKLHGVLPGSGCAVFISNTSQQVPIWCQSSAAQPQSPVVWDYHVVVLWSLHDGSAGWVIDLDSTLPFPCPIDQYISSALQPNRDAFQRHPDLRRRFRVVQAAEYLAHFSSDRSHMLVSRTDGELQYSSAPPTYPCISSTTCANNLRTYLDMSRIEEPEESPGTVCSGGSFGVVVSESSFIRLALSNELVSKGL